MEKIPYAKNGHRNGGNDGQYSSDLVIVKMGLFEKSDKSKSRDQESHPGSYIGKKGSLIGHDGSVDGEVIGKFKYLRFFRECFPI